MKKLSNKTKIFNWFRNLFIDTRMYILLRILAKNKSHNNLLTKLIPNNYQFPKGTIKKFVYKGIFLEVDIHDYVGHFLYFTFKDKGHEKLIDLIKEGDIVLDVGTNIGSTALQIARKIGGKGFVFGFEPDQENFKNCLKNIRLNNFNNIKVEKIGLGEKKGTFDLVVDTESNRGGNRISFNTSKNQDKKSSKILVDTIDTWITKIQLDRLDFIKIDIEGFELKALKGGVRALEFYEPKLFIEVDDNNLKAVGDSAKELFYFLESLHYTSYNAATSETIKSSQDFTNCHFDILAEKQFED